MITATIYLAGIGIIALMTVKANKNTQELIKNARESTS